jgi:hypothetical protein
MLGKNSTGSSMMVGLQRKGGAGQAEMSTCETNFHL